MSARRVGALTLVFLSVLFGASVILGQIADRPNSSVRNRGIDVTTHKFRPVVSPDLIAVDASGMSVKGDATISPFAVQQIDALLRDKQARTEAQRKISSKLIYTARMLQGLPAAPNVPS